MKLLNWTAEQEKAFQAFLQFYKDEGDPVPRILIRPFRRGFRDREMKPDEISRHRGLLPVKGTK